MSVSAKLLFNNSPITFCFKWFILLSRTVLMGDETRLLDAYNEDDLVRIIACARDKVDCGAALNRRRNSPLMINSLDTKGPSYLSVEPFR